MKNVRIIPPKPKENKKLRVAAYCRVSTSGPEQLRSLDIQISAYTKMIKAIPTGCLPVFIMILKVGFAEVAEVNWKKC